VPKPLRQYDDDEILRPCFRCRGKTDASQMLEMRYRKSLKASTSSQVAAAEDELVPTITDYDPWQYAGTGLGDLAPNVEVGGRVNVQCGDLTWQCTKAADHELEFNKIVLADNPGSNCTAETPVSFDDLKNYNDLPK
jgi:hypothetical protein